MSETIQIMRAIIRRDMLIAARNTGDVIASLAYCIIIIALLPLAVGSDAALLQRIAPAMIWIAVFISSIPRMERFFAADAASGALDDLLLAPIPLWLAAMAKLISGWVIIALPLVLIAPLIALMLGVPPGAIPVLWAGIACGSIALILLGGLFGTLTIGARRGMVLVALLLLPLAIPPLVFGSAAAGAALAGDAAAPHLALLAAATLLLLAITPPAMAGALRLAGEGN